MSVPIIVREARDDEYEAIGQLHASTFASDPTYVKRFEGMNARTVLQWLWHGRAKASVEQGHGTVVVVERTDRKELVGVAWYWKMGESNPPRLPAYPAGSRQASTNQKSAPYIEWMKDLVTRYVQIICKCIRNPEGSSPMDRGAYPLCFFPSSQSWQSSPSVPNTRDRDWGNSFSCIS